MTIGPVIIVALLDLCIACNKRTTGQAIRHAPVKVKHKNYKRSFLIFTKSFNIKFAQLSNLNDASLVCLSITTFSFAIALFQGDRMQEQKVAPPYSILNQQLARSSSHLHRAKEESQCMNKSPCLLIIIADSRLRKFYRALHQAQRESSSTEE